MIRMMFLGMEYKTFTATCIINKQMQTAGCVCKQSRLKDASYRHNCDRLDPIAKAEEVGLS